MTSEFAVAVHALVFLNHKQTTVSSELLAQNICTNAARVRKVMAVLKRAGLIETKEGLDGGYLFTLPADGVTLCRIADALGARFVCASWHSGKADMPCLVASGMAGILDGIYDDLDALCRERLKKVTIGSIDRRIFGGKEAGINRQDDGNDEQKTKWLEENKNGGQDADKGSF